jgi:hypothetical protein
MRVSQSKQRLLELNKRLAQNLTDKGIEATENETTTSLVNKVSDISSSKPEQEKTVNITKNGTKEVLPDEGKVLSKVTVNVDVPSDDSFYNNFWDVWQENGKRYDYRGAFRDVYWTEKNFYPKYDIKPSYTQNMFDGSRIKIDLRERLKECGVVFDFSKITDRCNFTFNSSYFEALPTLDFTNFPVNLYPQFANCPYLHTIEKVILTREHTYHSGGGLFSSYSALENIIIEGEIGNSISFLLCSKLTVESAKSILTHLVNYKGTDNEYINSITFHSNVWDLLDTEGETSPDGTTWKDYADNKGWNY